jgi:hypothetical protein
VVACACCDRAGGYPPNLMRDSGHKTSPTDRSRASGPCEDAAASPGAVRLAGTDNPAMLRAHARAFALSVTMGTAGAARWRPTTRLPSRRWRELRWHRLR